MKYRGHNSGTAPLDNRPQGYPYICNSEFRSQEAILISKLPPLSLNGLLGAMRRLSETPAPNNVAPFVCPDDLQK